MKIYFAGLYDDDNLGDPVIAHCAESLYLRNLPKGTYEVGHISLNHFCFHPASAFTMKWLSISQKLPAWANRISEHLILREYERYFTKILKDADIVIAVGGGLIEFTGGRFADGLYSIAKACSKYNIPFIITATGVEGYDASNSRCVELKKMLHLPSLKHISTRDDIKTLIDSYYDGNPPIKCEQVADTAVWASEIFDVTKDITSKTIGIGIIRENIFQQYGIPFEQSRVVDLYCRIASELIKDGHEVVLFTNGTKADNDSAKKVSHILNESGIKVRLQIPQSADELINIISKFQAIIAGRLHSCIISYSLDIPAIGLVWNEKLSMFGIQCGHPENFINPNQLNSKHIIKQLYLAIEKGYDQQHRDIFRRTILDSIDYCVEKYISR